jgi:hypothetical protein
VTPSQNSRGIRLLSAAGTLFLTALALSQSFPPSQNWTDYVRIGAYGVAKVNPVWGPQREFGARDKIERERISALRTRFCNPVTEGAEPERIP